MRPGTGAALERHRRPYLGGAAPFESALQGLAHDAHLGPPGE